MHQNVDSEAAPGNERHASYVKDVLDLREDETEEGLDERLRSEAKELGLDSALWMPFDMKPPSKKPASSDISRRSQESFASHSTGLMSTFSDTSRDQQAARGPYRASLSFRDYDAFVARGRRDGRNSVSFSPPTTPSQSMLSLALSSPESSPKRHFRRIRGLSMLRLGRNSSSTSLADSCPHCPHDAQSQRRAVHKLPCGHRLCTQALRCNINAAAKQQQHAVPSCCDIPIPGSLVEHVTTQAEQGALLSMLVQQNDELAVGGIGGPMIAPVSSHVLAQESKLDERQPAPQQMPEHLELKQIKQDQAEQLARLLTWTSQQESLLATQHRLLREQIKAIHATALEELEDAHGAAMAEAEDKQVKAEGDMRDAHEREKRDNATALKHMEAYCAGTYSSGELHNRPVTAQDVAELEKTRRTREQMDAKHESAINILRGEQSRRIRMRGQRQEREEQELRRAQRKEDLDLERTCGQEEVQLASEVVEKREQLRHRWQLQTAIVAKKLQVAIAPLPAPVLPNELQIPLVEEWQLIQSDEHATLPGAAETTRYETTKNGFTGIAMHATSGYAV